MDVKTQSLNREVVLHVNQLLSGGSGGILQAILASVCDVPTVADTFILTDGSRTETWVWAASRTVAFTVAQGASAAAAQTNIIAAIVADSSLWSAIATTNLGRFFTLSYPTQFIIYRKAVANEMSAADRLYGVIDNSQADIQVVAFGQAGYSAADATQSNMPATDPGSKKFGLGRSVANVGVDEEHRALENGLLYCWVPVGQAWRSEISGSLLRDRGTIAIANMATSFEVVFPIGRYKHASIRLSAPGAGGDTHVGTFAFSGSHTGVSADKVALTLTSTITAASATVLNALVELDVYGGFVHVNYTATSGAGTCTITAQAKE